MGERGSLLLGISAGKSCIQIAPAFRKNRGNVSDRSQGVVCLTTRGVIQQWVMKWIKRKVIIRGRPALKNRVYVWKGKVSPRLFALLFLFYFFGRRTSESLCERESGKLVLIQTVQVWSWEMKGAEVESAADQSRPGNMGGAAYLGAGVHAVSWESSVCSPPVQRGQLSLFLISYVRLLGCSR